MPTPSSNHSETASQTESRSTGSGGRESGLADNFAAIVAGASAPQVLPLAMGPLEIGPISEDLGLVDCYQAIPAMAVSPEEKKTVVTPRSQEATNDWSVRFASAILPEDWNAIVRRIDRAAEVKARNLLVPVGTMANPNYRAIVEPILWTRTLGWETLAQRMQPEHLRQKGPLSIKRALRIIRDLSAALADLKTNRLTHAWINPENVLVDERGHAILLWMPGVFLRCPALASQVESTGKTKPSPEPSNAADRAAPPVSAFAVKAVPAPEIDFEINTRDSQVTGKGKLNRGRKSTEDFFDVGPSASMSSPLTLPQRLCQSLCDQHAWNWAPVDFLSAAQMSSLHNAAPQDDIFALGCLLHFLLLGKTPFAARDWAAQQEGRQRVAEVSLPEDAPQPVIDLFNNMIRAAKGSPSISAADLVKRLDKLLRITNVSATSVPIGSARDLQNAWSQISTEKHWIDPAGLSPAAAEIETKDSVNADDRLPDLAMPKITLSRGSATNLPSIDTGVGTGVATAVASSMIDANADSDSFDSRSSRSELQANASGSRINQRRGRRNARDSQSKSQSLFWWLGSAAASTLFATLIGAWGLGFLGERPDRDGEKVLALGDPSTNDKSAAEETALASTAVSNAWMQKVVPDDGTMLWESPTTGLPVSIDHLPNGPVALLILQDSFWNQAPMAALIQALDVPQSGEVAKVVRAYQTDLRLEQFSRTVVAQYQIANQTSHALALGSDKAVTLKFPGWKAIAKLADASPDPTVAAALADSPQSAAVSPDQTPATESTTAADSSLESPQTSESPQTRSGQLLLARTAGDRIEVILLDASAIAAGLWDALPELPQDQVNQEMFDPALADTQLADETFSVNHLLLASPDLMEQSLKDTGPTTLSLPMQTALAASDRQRQLQVLFTPVAIWNEAGKTWLGNRWGWVCELMKDKMPASVRCVYLSLDYPGEGACYFEAKLVADRAQNWNAPLAALTGQLSTAISAAERGVLDAPRSPYWENSLLRYDDMLSDWAGRLRSGLHQDLPTFNAWLPEQAPAHTVAATDVYFAAISAGRTQSASPNLDPASNNPNQVQTPSSLENLLQRKRSINIPEQDLVNALAELQSEIKAEYVDLPFELEIELDGNNLRTEGITQNQKIVDFDLKDASLADILAALVLKATPDKTAASPNDPKCKLIWLIDPRSPSSKILITTRAAAKTNNWTLPPQVAETP